MSKRVLFVCVVLLLIGLSSAWEIVTSLVAGRFFLDVGVLFLPASIGLLLGWPGARDLAKSAFILSYGVLLIMAGWTLFGKPAVVEGQDPWRALVSSKAFVMVLVTMMACVLGLLHWLLYSPPFDEYLSRRRVGGKEMTND